ncbi:MAG TPA: L-serine ammonia-lyase, iron-sulfur-dependent subunit beta [Trueperaceae bacterium]|nr:L-serine ammonia-lyase, iron-sulfur-dependent subunit beta [Trueperaceae bacterium]
MALLDQIGPVMVGPSSSHTAGACRIALLARHCLTREPAEARFVLHGSFAKTAKGHGTDLALVAGTLGYLPDDPRIRRAFDEAAEAGLAHEFTTADLGDVHPNSVSIELRAGDERLTLLGSSLGGGLVQVSRVDGFDVRFSGAFHTLLVLHTDRPGVIARVAGVVADDDGNIGSILSARERRGGRAMMSVEIDKSLSQAAVDYLGSLPYVHWFRALPEVMRNAEEPVTGPMGGERE